MSGYLDFAERQAEREIAMTMEDWQGIWRLEKHGLKVTN